MARLGIPCPLCGYARSHVVETRADLTGRRPRVWRIRLCDDCGHLWVTAEVAPHPDGRSRIRLPEPSRRLSQLRAERHLVRRAGAA